MDANFKYTYSLFVEKELVIVKYKGIVDVADVITLIEKIVKHPDYKPTFNFLLDTRNSTFRNRTEKVKLFLSYIKERYPYMENVKTAFISNSPNQVVIATVMRLLLGAKGKNIRVCSTSKCALKWLAIHEAEAFETFIEEKI